MPLADVGRDSCPGASARRLVAVAAVLLGASISPPAVAVACFLGGGALWLSSYRARHEVGAADHRWVGTATVILVLGSVWRSIGPIPEAFTDQRDLLLGLGGAAGASLLFGGDRRTGRVVATVLSAAVVILLTGTLLLSEWRSPLGTDVYHAHMEAGEALRSGENPYGDTVEFVDGSAFSEAGRTVRGYPYPPVTLLAYAGAGMLLDPRIVSAGSWLVVLGWFGARALQKSSRSAIGTGAFVLMASYPAWSVIWYAGWTEPLSLLLFLMTATQWRRHPVLSAVFLGLALASKQYFVFLAPLVLILRDEDAPRRASVAIGTIVATLLPPLVVDARAFVEATLLNLAEIEFRPDSQSLTGVLAITGVEFVLPRWTWFLTGMAVSVGVARLARSRSEFLAGAGAVMAFAFLAGLAFPNYWFLVAGLFALATVSAGEDVVDPTRAIAASDGSQDVSNEPGSPGPRLATSE